MSAKLPDIIEAILKPNGGIALARPRKVRVRPQGDVQMAERLTQMRESRGLSQKELAERVEVYQSDISNYERGKYRPQSDILVKIAQVLRVSTDELLGLKRSSPAGPPVQPRRILRRVQMLEQLPKRDQQMVFRLIDKTVAASTNGRR